MTSVTLHGIKFKACLQARLDIDGPNVAIGRDDEVAVMSVGEFHAVITLPEHPRFIPAKSQVFVSQLAATSDRPFFERGELGCDPFFPLCNRIPWLTHICHSADCSRSFRSAAESGAFCFCKVHILCASSKLMGRGS